jgi:hypothetical protein
MNPESATTNRGTEARDALAARAGQTCITLFVVFAVSLIAFGQPPAHPLYRGNRFVLYLDVFSR